MPEREAGLEQNTEQEKATNIGIHKPIQKTVDLGDGETMEIEVDEFDDPDDTTDPDKGQSGKEESADGQSDKKYSPGFLDKYRNKSNEDLLDSLHNLEKLVGKQGEKLSSAQANVKRTSEAIKTEAKSLTKTIADKERELDDLDPIIDAEDYKSAEEDLQKLQKKSEDLLDELSDMQLDEKIDKKLHEDFNKEFFQTARDSLKKDFGYDFEDDAWQSIEANAKEINGLGKITPESVEAALVQSVGAEKYRKVLTSQGEINFREKLQKAHNNATPMLGDKGSKSANAIDLNDTSAAEYDVAIRKMTPKQFAEHMRKNRNYRVR